MYALILLLTISFLPLLIHISKLSQAQQKFDYKAVGVELEWIKSHYPWTYSLPKIADIDLWLKLNQGEGLNIKDKLSKFKDDKHLFWYFQLELSQGNIDSAGNTLERISDRKLRILGQALLEMARGNIAQAKLLLESTQIEWDSLNPHLKVLRFTTLAHIDLILEDYENAQVNINNASSLESENPIVIGSAYYLAVMTKNWREVERLSTMIQPEKLDRDLIFLISMGLVAIQKQDSLLLEKTIQNLKSLDNGLAYVSYLQGIKLLSADNLKDGIEKLDTAIQLGLDGMIKKDAEIAKLQAEKRLQAENALRPIINGGGQ